MTSKVPLIAEHLVLHNWLSALIFPWSSMNIALKYFPHNTANRVLAQSTNFLDTFSSGAEEILAIFSCAFAKTNYITLLSYFKKAIRS